MFGLFDPPRLKAQKRGANSAQVLREQAAREAALEVSMLVKRHDHAHRLYYGSNTEGKDDLNTRFVISLGDAQDCIDRVGHFMSDFQYGMREMQSPRTSEDYEKLSSFELQARDVLLKIRDDAKVHLSRLGVLCMEVTK